MKNGLAHRQWRFYLILFAHGRLAKSMKQNRAKTEVPSGNRKYSNGSGVRRTTNSRGSA